MRKALLTYFSLGLASIAVVAAFISAATYLQLTIAALLYPILMIYAYKVLPIVSANTHHLQDFSFESAKPKDKTAATQKDSVTISDLDKRAFLKLIGATGISFFLISVFSRKVESVLLGQKLLKSPNSDTTAFSPTNGYTISEIGEGVISYYGFINKVEGWFIMQGDSNTGSFRYAKGNSNFPDNWKNRAKLKYDYFYNVFL